jgi:PAS domain S-box-containing protein
MKKNNQSEASSLRQRAEELLRNEVTKSIAQLSEAEIYKLVHELQVHQIELQLQNDELIQAKEQAAIASEKYIELYDLSPTGYFTLSRNGEILQLNLSGAKMLGKYRSHLINSQFKFFISDDSKLHFKDFLGKVFSSKAKVTCEVILKTDVELPITVYLEGIVSGNNEQCLLTAVDISERKFLETSLMESKILLDETERTGKIGGWTFNTETLTQTWTQETFDILEIETTKGSPMVPQGLEFIDEPYRQMAELAIQRAIEYGEAYDQEWIVTTAKGNKRWVNAIGKVALCPSLSISTSRSFPTARLETS